MNFCHYQTQILRQFVVNEDEGFVKICTPKLIPHSSKGGAAVFKLGYKKKHMLACPVTSASQANGNLR